MIYIILLSGIIIVASIWYWPTYIKKRRNKIRLKPFPMEWDQALTNYWPIFSRLPYDLKIKLRRHIQVFISEKKIIACQGLDLTEKERVIIAAQACLLIVNKRFEHYDLLKDILVYPSSFVTGRSVNLGNGTVSRDSRILSGESWESGKIVLSWNDTVNGIANDKDGSNVVIHEFAHLLDHESGNANGAPVLKNQKDYIKWSEVLSKSFDRLCNKIEHGEPGILNPYAATNAAEFFAVVSEVFFENGQMLRRDEPELYEQLTRFYEVDTASWDT